MLEKQLLNMLHCLERIVFIIFTPKFGSGTTLPGRQREQGRFRGSIVVTIILGIGFGRRGVVAGKRPIWFNSKRPLTTVSGTAAALFQSVFYRAFTPAAGIIATLTSVAMTGKLFCPAAVLATLVAAVV